jgi:hypothetical protein
MEVTFFNSGSKSNPIELFPSIVRNIELFPSIVLIIKLFPSIVLIIAGEKGFPPSNFNLKIMRIQRGGGSWMLLDALLHC